MNKTLKIREKSSGFAPFDALSIKLFLSPLSEGGLVGVFKEVDLPIERGSKAGFWRFREGMGTCHNLT
jgi:hypothetical protein